MMTAMAIAMKIAIVVELVRKMEFMPQSGIRDFGEAELNL